MEPTLVSFRTAWKDSSDGLSPHGLVAGLGCVEEDGIRRACLWWMTDRGVVMSRSFQIERPRYVFFGLVREGGTSHLVRGKDFFYANPHRGC
jgi:hypothetical protein